MTSWVEERFVSIYRFEKSSQKSLPTSLFQREEIYFPL
jgi:hypothetical protein